MIAPPSQPPAASEARFIAIDLSAPIADLPGLVAQLRDASPSATLLSYGPHVHEARLQAARDAGCDLVISRGQFHKQLAELLVRHTQGDA